MRRVMALLALLTLVGSASGCVVVPGRWHHVRHFHRW
jgi:hypothetical protein